MRVRVILRLIVRMFVVGRAGQGRAGQGRAGQGEGGGGTWRNVVCGRKVGDVALDVGPTRPKLWVCARMPLCLSLLIYLYE